MVGPKPWAIAASLCQRGHTWQSYTKFLLDTLPKRLQNNYVKKFKTSIQFWHETGGGLSEEVIRELEEHGYQIQRNGVSNYTLDKNPVWSFLDRFRIIRMILRVPKTFQAGNGCVIVF